MKKSALKIVLLLFTFNFSLSTVFAQSPKAFKYQAVARDAGGSVLANHIVNFRISILKSSMSGTAVYVETQKDTTNQFGLANLKIGMGTLVSGSFTTINWGNDQYFVKIEMDANGGTSFQNMGTSQLLSVPYALYSENSGGSTLWSQNGNAIYPTNISTSIGIGITTPSEELHINGCLRLDGTGGLGNRLVFHSTASSGHQYEWYGDSPADGYICLYDRTAGARRIIFDPNGNVGIGTSTTTYKLSVNGTIRAKEVIVNTGWSDFVFEKDYKLMSLGELEKYINKNKHLPNMPSAAEIEKNGASLGDISSKLLQQIEELNLRMIDQSKKYESEIKLLNEKIKKLENNKNQ